MFTRSWQTLLLGTIALALGVTGHNSLASPQTAAAPQGKKAATAAPAKSSPSPASSAPLPLKDPRELKLSITVEASDITNSPTWDGDIRGKVTKFSVGDKAVELETDEIAHESGKAWIVTKKYGKIIVAGAYGPYVEHTNLGSMSTNYIPPNTVTVGYVIPNVYNGLCIWLTQSQKAELKKLL